MECLAPMKLLGAGRAETRKKNRFRSSCVELIAYTAPSYTWGTNYKKKHTHRYGMTAVKNSTPQLFSGLRTSYPGTCSHVLLIPITTAITRTVTASFIGVAKAWSSFIASARSFSRRSINRWFFSRFFVVLSTPTGSAFFFSTTRFFGWRKTGEEGRLFTLGEKPHEFRGGQCLQWAS